MEDVTLEVLQILNMFATRKVRINLLVIKCGFTFEEAEILVGPERASDY